MYKAEFTVEALTPIFMRGANQKEVEMRVPSIKGVMRWWFRALAGNYFGNDIGQLREAENYVFGSTGGKSRIVVEVKCDEERCPVPEIVDLFYLWFPIKMMTDEQHTCYNAGTTFNVTFASYDKKAFNLALTSFWTLVTLGGIGFRNRRGAGSLTFADRDFESLKELGLLSSFNSPDELKGSIENAINKVRVICGKRKLDNLKPQSYAILNASTSYIGLMGKEGDTIKENLKNFQKVYKELRGNDQYKNSRIIFGLPIVKGILDAKLQKIAKAERRASPVHIGVVFVNNKPYTKIIKFKTEPYHSNVLVNAFAKWDILEELNEKLYDVPIFGSMEVFK